MYYLKSRYYDPGICRFINADSIVSTDRGFVGFNVFAYCSDNPVAMIDTNGKLPAFVFKIGELIEDALNELGIGDFSNLSIEKQKNSIKIVNSSRIKDPLAILIYSFYLNHLSEYKDFFSGSTVGIAYEWFLHNIAYDGARLIESFGKDLTSVKKQAKDVDIGSTIFHDRHKFLSVIMDYTYYKIAPIQAFTDAIITLFGG